MIDNAWLNYCTSITWNYKSKWKWMKHAINICLKKKSSLWSRTHNVTGQKNTFLTTILPRLRRCSYHNLIINGKVIECFLWHLFIISIERHSCLMWWKLWLFQYMMCTRHYMKSLFHYMRCICHYTRCIIMKWPPRIMTNAHHILE